MLSTAIIIFREVLEISLIVGVVLAATRGIAGRARWVWGGFFVGMAGSVIVAYFAKTISQWAQGMGQEVFNAVVLFLAAALIAWTTIWMKRHGRKLTRHFQEVGREVLEGKRPLSMLAVVILLAVLREGSEIVLFVYGILASGEKVADVLAGCGLGLFGGGFVGVLIYYGLIKISPKYVFSVTAWLLAFLASGMVSQALGLLAQAGFVPELVSQVWDTSGILPEKNWLGMVLHALLGYTERPSGIQLVGYWVTLGGIVMLLKFYGNGSRKKVAAMAAVMFLGGALLSPGSSWAGEKVYSPIVQKGELEIEIRGNYDFDHRDTNDGASQQKYALGYGVTDRWFTEVYGEWKKEPEENEDFEFEGTEWENRFQLAEQGDWWIDMGIYLSYEFANKADDPDKLETKLLLEKQFGDFLHTVNLTLEKEVGGKNEKGLEGGFAWSGRYRWKKWLEPGVEWQSDLGELDHTGSFDEQPHQLGPVIYGKIGDPIKYDVGYLFGASNAAPDGELKWIVEFEWYF